MLLMSGFTLTACCNCVVSDLWGVGYIGLKLKGVAIEVCRD